MKFDILRLQARCRAIDGNLIPATDRLHLGCGDRVVQHWLNVDVSNSDHDVDLLAKRLPWATNTFNVIVSQHLIEHLDMNTELIPLMAELRRILKPMGEAWLSCPNLAAVC
jgi:predicted SAM-dependent methyltransferase